VVVVTYRVTFYREHRSIMTHGAVGLEGAVRLALDGLAEMAPGRAAALVISSTGAPVLRLDLLGSGAMAPCGWRSTRAGLAMFDALTCAMGGVRW